jgi:hypothetical protein
MRVQEIMGVTVGEEGFGSAIDMPGPWVLVLGSYRCPPTRGMDASRFELPRPSVT